MTDLELTREMFRRAGVVFTDWTCGESPDPGLQPGETVLNCEAKMGPANEGYHGFVASLTFNPDGSLKSVGAWE